MHTTPEEVVRLIDELLDDHSYKQITDTLNRKKLRSGDGRRFTQAIVLSIRHSYNLKTRYDRLREKGYLTTQELSKRLGVSNLRVYELRDQGYLEVSATNCRKHILFKPPTRKMEQAIKLIPPKQIGRPPKKNT